MEWVEWMEIRGPIGAPRQDFYVSWLTMHARDYDKPKFSDFAMPWLRADRGAVADYVTPWIDPDTDDD